MTIADLLSKKIVVLGLGVNHLCLVQFLLKQGITLTIRDKNARSLEEFSKEHPEFDSQITWEVSESIVKNLDGFDVIFRTPSIPIDVPELVKAVKKGTQLYSQTKLFFDLCPAPIIGVTGSKGKGTTASLIQAVLKKGYTEGIVYLAGNIGIDPFSFYEKIRETDVVILELSSFQLEDLHKSPHISVLLTVDSEHLLHHKTLEGYKKAKRQILANQSLQDYAIINLQFPVMKEFLRSSPGLLYTYSRHTPRKQAAWSYKEGEKEFIFYQMGSEIFSFESTDRKLLGEHNLDNILPAVLVGQLYNIDVLDIQEAVCSFAGLEHRLSFLGKYQGVEFYEDSFATTPEAAKAAIETFKHRRLHLIVGGSEEGGDYASLVPTMVSATTISLLPGSATKKLQQYLKKLDHKATILDKAQDPLFPTILSGIHPHLQDGDVVLLSPGAKSFASFKNYKERGELFIKAVNDRYNSESI